MNQLAFHFISNANALLDKRHDIDVTAFLCNQSPPLEYPKFASMNINEAFDFDGAAVATTIYTAEKLARFPGPKLRYFYLWDMEWMRKPYRNFEELVEIYNNPGIKLVARHEEHKDIINKCWNRSAHAVIPDCDMGAFVEMIRKDDKK